MTHGERHQVVHNSSAVHRTHRFAGMSITQRRQKGSCDNGNPFPCVYRQIPNPASANPMPYHAPSQAVSKPLSIPLFTKPHVEENTLPDVNSQGFSLIKEKLIPHIPSPQPRHPSYGNLNHYNSTQKQLTMEQGILVDPPKPQRKSHSFAVLPAIQPAIPQLALYRNFEWTSFHHHLPPFQRVRTRHGLSRTPKAVPLSVSTLQLLLEQQRPCQPKHISVTELCIP